MGSVSVFSATDAMTGSASRRSRGNTRRRRWLPPSEPPGRPFHATAFRARCPVGPGAGAFATAAGEDAAICAQSHTTYRWRPISEALWASSAKIDWHWYLNTRRTGPEPPGPMQRLQLPLPSANRSAALFVLSGKMIRLSGIGRLGNIILDIIRNDGSKTASVRWPGW